MSELQIAATDRAAVDRFQEGEWAAFDELYERHWDRLYRYCQYRLRDRHEAEDVAQEAFVRAWRSMPAFGGDRNFYPWLRVVAANLCTDALRRRSRSEPAADLDLDSLQGVEHPETTRLEREDDRQMVRQALARLNARHQTALMMREEEGLAYEEIAARTGVSTATVESLLWRARQAFRREFTVLSAGQACLAILAVPAALTGRFRSLLQAVTSRFHSRMSLAGFLSYSSDAAGYHSAALTTAGVAVATVVAAAVGIGAAGPSAPAPPPVTVFAPGSPVAASGSSAPTAPGPAASRSRSTASTPVPSPGPGSKPAAGTGSAPVSGPSSTVGVGPATTTGGAGGGTRAWKLPAVVIPLHPGTPAATPASQYPVSVVAGSLVIGIDPAPVTSLARSAATKLSSPLAPVAAATRAATGAVAGAPGSHAAGTGTACLPTAPGC
ncbi:MAG TPA: sigma-70 family RNA polymerase sigma factor [Acidimicrobiales bacterium]|nr:sigma-70 family RNA polymerase sigma factor [Acidimicrobiales bacterium]